MKFLSLCLIFLLHFLSPFAMDGGSQQTSPRSDGGDSAKSSPRDGSFHINLAGTSSSARSSPREGYEEPPLDSPRSTKDTLCFLINVDGSINQEVLLRWIEQEATHEKHKTLLGLIFKLAQVQERINVLQAQCRISRTFDEQIFVDGEVIAEKYRGLHELYQTDLAKKTKTIEEARRLKETLIIKIKKKFLRYGFIFNAEMFLNALENAQLVATPETPRKPTRNPLKALARMFSRKDVAEAAAEAITRDPSSENLFEAASSSGELAGPPEAQEPAHPTTPAVSPRFEFEKAGQDAPQREKSQSTRQRSSSTPPPFRQFEAMSRSMPVLSQYPGAAPGPIFVDADGTITDSQGKMIKKGSRKNRPVKRVPLDRSQSVHTQISEWEARIATSQT